MFMIPLSHRAASDSQSAALSLTSHEISEREKEREREREREREERERERGGGGRGGDAVHRGGERERETGSPHSTVSSQRSADTHRKQDYSRLLSIEVSGEII